MKLGPYYSSLKLLFSFLIRPMLSHFSLILPEKMCNWNKYDWDSDLLGMNGWLCDFNMFLSTYLIFFCLPKTQLWLFIQSMMGMSVKSRNKLLELRLTIANMSPIILCWKISCRVGTMSLSYEYFLRKFYTELFLSILIGSKFWVSDQIA